MKKEARIMIIATMSSIILLIASYLYNNNPYPVFDNIENYAWLELARQKITKSDNLLDDVVFINVAYDKKIVPFYDEYGMPLGNIDITDRRKLAKLLDLLHGANYKYLFLDVRFEDGYSDTEHFNSDSSNSETIDEHLFTAITNTPRLVVATHRDIKLLSTSIENKTALSDYLSTITATNFVKYEYLHDEKESVPIRIYSQVSGHKVEKMGPLMFDNGRLCHNCPFMQIPIPFETNNDGYMAYLNLGVDILDETLGGIGTDLRKLVSKKYVFIGDFINDKHDTYIGPQPGAYIAAVAMQSLFRGKHLVDWLSALCMGLAYFVFTIFMFWKVDIRKFMPYFSRQNSRILRFIVSFFGISFVLYCITDTIYLISGETFCLLIPSLYFTMLRTIITYKNI